MKNILPLLILLLCSVSICTAQEQQTKKKKKFSQKEYQTRQKAFITEYAGLTPQEADAFFPLFFENKCRKRWMSAFLRVESKSSDQKQESKRRTP